MTGNKCANLSLACGALLLGLSIAGRISQAQQPARRADSEGPRFIAPQTPDADPSEAAPRDNSKSRTSEAPPPSNGRGAVMQAFYKSKTARQESDYSEIIDLCRAGLQGGLRAETVAYTHRLLAWALNRRGEIQAKAGHDTLALADFNAAVEFDSGLWRTVHNRGVSYATLGKYKQAITDFNRTIKLKPNYPNAYFNRGELLYEQKNFPDAIADYNEALRLVPKDSAAHNSRGHAYYRMNRFREAIQDYSEAIRLQPDNAAAYTNRGDAYADLRQYGQAAKDYKSAIRVNPKLGRAYQSAAWLMATCPDPQYRNDRLAVATATRAMELDGDDDYRYLETLAAAQAAAGNFKEAQEIQERVIQAAPKKNLGRSQRRLQLYARHLPYRETPREPQRTDNLGQARRRPVAPYGNSAR